ncbi:hypothetical protein [Polaribacter sp.]|uniref:hypothetical protein n=1 Tax=Polaribacter sp. TaxID=1920175 RepID=UPI003EF17B63
MLYIKFKILEKEYFEAFKEVYKHMCAVREPGYTEKEDTFEIDWNTATEEEIDDFMNDDRPKIELYKSLFPEYADQFLRKFFSKENASSVLVDENIVSYFNYLEYGFEVDLDCLELLKDEEGIVKYSTGNFPYGGMDRFLMSLKAFRLIPIECFDGFNVFEFDWISEFDYEAVILPEQTNKYLGK